MAAPDRGDVARGPAVDPVAALKDSGAAPTRRRLALALVATQTAFCMLVLSAGAQFVTSFDRLSNHSLGFSPDGVLVMEANGREPSAPPTSWGPVSDALRAMSGVQDVAVAGWAPLSGNRQTAMVGAVGRPIDSRAPYFVNVSPRYFDTLRIGFVDGRDFRSADVPPVFDTPRPATDAVAIVNEAFARQYFEGQSPVGWRVNIRGKGNLDVPVAIVGLVRDTAYSSVREPMHAIVYLPLGPRRQAAILVRAAGSDPLALAPSVRRPLKDSHPELQLDVTTQSRARCANRC